MNHTRESNPWTSSSPTPAREALLSPATQIVADRDAYLGQNRNDVGRRVAEDQVELFVAGDTAASLQREFEQHAGEFIALHDLGAGASLRLLGGLTGAAGARVQRLTIRRQGHGVALAVLHFAEVPLADGATVRVYSTEVEADPAARQQLGRVLLGWSRLGVLLVGDLPAASVVAAIRPLHEAIARGPWPNRELLMVPLGGGTVLAALAQQLRDGTPVQVHVAPRAVQPRQIWHYVGGTWNRLHAQSGSTRRIETDIERAVPRPAVPWSEASTEPMGLDPAPAPASVLPMVSRPMPLPGATRWQPYAERCAAIKGALASCVLDVHTAKALASAGATPSVERLAEQGAALLAAAGESARALGLGAAPNELALSTPGHHLVLRPVAGHPGVALLVVLQASATHPMLARMQLDRIEPPA